MHVSYECLFILKENKHIKEIIYDNYFYRHNYTIIALYILERPSAWSTLQIRPAWPRFRDGLNLLLTFFHKCLPCLFWPTQYLAACFNGSHFTLNPPFPAGQLNTSIQVNNTATPHRIYTDTHIYITFILLSILFFTLLPSFWASRLAQTLPIWHNNNGRLIREGNRVAIIKSHRW